MLHHLEVTDAFAILRADPAKTGIFSDFDGTLSPIVSDPADAKPADGVVDALEELAEVFGLVAIVSARSLEDLHARIKPKGVLLAGAYGRERSDQRQRRRTEGWETVAVAATGAVRGLPGVRVERKGTGVALHFRGAEEHEDAVRSVAETLAEEFSLQLRPGRMVCDLIVPGPGKGEAIAALVQERTLRCALVAGDDIADVEAFAMLRGTDVRTVIVAVTSAEAPPDLGSHADIIVEGPDELARLLQGLARR